MILMPKIKGQISLEFLIVLLTMVVLLIMFLPSLGKLHKSSLLALDVYNATTYLNKLDVSLATLNALDVGSSFSIKMNFVYDSDFFCKDNKFGFNLNNSLKQKTLFLETSFNCDFLEHFNKISLFFEKTSQNDLNIFVV